MGHLGDPKVCCGSEAPHQCAAETTFNIRLTYEKVFLSVQVVGRGTSVDAAASRGGLEFGANAVIGAEKKVKITHKPGAAKMSSYMGGDAEGDLPIMLRVGGRDFMDGFLRVRLKKLYEHFGVSIFALDFLLMCGIPVFYPDRCRQRSFGFE